MSMKKIKNQNIMDDPTGENILQIIEDDIFERNTHVKEFISYLGLIDRHMSINIDAGWGAGKTFFVKQTCAMIDKNKESNLKAFYYDAWANDYHSDPALSLLFNIIKEFKINIPKDKAEFFVKLVKYFTRALPYIPEIDLEDFKEEDFFESISSAEKVQEAFELILSSLTEKGEKLVIFIDELDRCRPDYALKLLERVKHLFTNKDIIFVFTSNNEALKSLVKHYYGSDMKPEMYFNKIFQRHYPFPRISIKDYLEKFLDIRYINCLGFDATILEIATYYNMHLREQNKLIRLVAKFLEKATPHGEGSKFLYCSYMPFLFGVSVADRETFNGLLNDELSAKTKISEMIKNDDKLSKKFTKDKITSKPHGHESQYSRDENNAYLDIFLGITKDNEFPNVLEENKLKRFYENLREIIVNA